jgi:hypothetical protein
MGNIAESPASPGEPREGKQQVPALKIGFLSSLLTLLAVAGALLMWSWRAWPDLLIDFGRELYVPWRLSLGEHLYTDIAYFNGPLSPYLNSLVFRLCGPGVLTLSLANLLVLSAVVALLYRLLVVVSDRLSALAACVVFLPVFGFGREGYNFLAPYSHELTHGLLVCLAGLACVEAFHRTRRNAWVVLAGLSVGLSFLTKPEILLAATSIPLGLWLSIMEARSEDRRVSHHLTLFCGGVVGVVGFTLVLLSLAMPLQTAVGGVFGSLRMATNPEINSLLYYRGLLGLNDPGLNLRLIGGWGVAYLLLLGLPAIWAGRARGARRAVLRVLVGAAVLISSCAVFMSAWIISDWRRAARPLPFAILGLLLFAFFRRKRTTPIPGARWDHPLTVAFLALSVLLLMKTFFGTRIIHYGFGLAMPAGMAITVALLSWVPAEVRQRGGQAFMFRSWAAGFLLAFLIIQLNVTGRILAERDYTVGSGADAIRTDRLRGEIVDRALSVAQETLGPGGTLAVIPEGATLNFLLRRPNPTPYTNLMPPEVIHFREAEILRAFRNAPPDMILAVHKDTEFFGVGNFGVGYALEFAAWVGDHYRLLDRIGDPPFASGSTFGVDILVWDGPRAAPTSR